MEKKMKSEIKERLEQIENLMSNENFWQDKDNAQKVLKEYTELKENLAKENAIEKSGCTITIFAGAGGDDAEDWTNMLFEMYKKFAENKFFEIEILDETKNSYGGFRNISFSVKGEFVYKILKNETGVHRLIRNSPFNSKGLRQTSFAYVEIVPILPFAIEVFLKEEDLQIQFTKSSGPGGQNVNKRETAVRIEHIPTGIKTCVQTERSQEKNKEIAINFIKSKLFLLEKEKQELIKNGFVSDFKKGTDIEWGSQIRSYTLHPYKLIKDHRTNIETSDIENVLYKGDLQIFLK